MSQQDDPPELDDRHLLLRFLDRVSIQAALIAGFAFAALAEVLSASLPLPYWRGMLRVNNQRLALLREVHCLRNLKVSIAWS